MPGPFVARKRWGRNRTSGVGPLRVVYMVIQYLVLDASRGLRGLLQEVPGWLSTQVTITTKTARRGQRPKCGR